MMRSRQPVVRTLAGLATLLLPACSMSTRQAVEPPLAAASAPAEEEEEKWRVEAYVGDEESPAPSEVAPVATDPAPVGAAPVRPPAPQMVPEPELLPEAAVAPEAAQFATTNNKEINELRSEIRRLSEREAASREALDTLKTMMQARAARPQVTYMGTATTGAFTAPAPAVNTSLAPADDPETARERAKMQQQVRQLEEQLASERQQRQELETQLKQLREETAVGPYADSVSDELVAARRKVQGLEAALASAQRARDELAAKNDELKAQSDRDGEKEAETQAQIAAFEQRQREALQGLEQELAASQAREQELRQAVTETEKTDNEVSYALVTDLRAENAALKAKLSEAQERNAALSSKLKTASRVTEMIFKQRAAPRPEPRPRPRENVEVITEQGSGEEPGYDGTGYEDGR